MGNHAFQAKFYFFLVFYEIFENLRHAELRSSSLWTKNNVKTAQKVLRLFISQTEKNLPFLDFPSTLDSAVQTSDKSLYYDF